MIFKFEKGVFARDHVIKHPLDETITVFTTITKGTPVLVISGGDTGVYYRAECIVDIIDSENPSNSIMGAPMRSDFYTSWSSLGGRLVDENGVDMWVRGQPKSERG